MRDVVVVGSGPSGYTAAIYAARAGLEPVVIAGAVTAGGALVQTTEVENFPGFPDGVMGPDLMDSMQRQAERFGADLVFDDAVELDLTGPVKVVRDRTGRTYRSRAVVLATGSGYRRLDVPGEERLTGHGVSWCATCDGFFFRGKDVVVVGGGDSAVEEATFLTRFASSVTLVHRRDTLRASKIMAERAAADPRITFAWNSEVVEVLGEEKVEAVTLRDSRSGEQRRLETAGVFIAIGHDPRSELLKGQVRTDSEGYVLVDSPTTHTNLPGVFACGDLVDSRYRQAITASGTGCAAALDAERYLTSLADARLTGDAVQAAVG
ncbi:thioredoxin-disulfide reductase [Kineococcus gypseus]|uniref:thioredoxin-disulfide reductase n=1 Tax=Kineococcus gypseus TaxID=1637102 RepID=UPI003D7C6AEA